MYQLPLDCINIDGLGKTVHFVLRRRTKCWTVNSPSETSPFGTMELWGKRLEESSDTRGDREAAPLGPYALCPSAAPAMDAPA